ncbi:MAG: sensor histidine kinase [Stackebrandtia sp.]
MINRAGDQTREQTLRGVLARLWRHVAFRDTMLGILVQGLFAFFVVVGQAANSEPDVPVTSMFWVWLALGVIPTALRRLLPWWALALLVASMLATPLDYAAWNAAAFTSMILGYTLASHQRLRLAIAGNVILWGVVTAMSLFASEEEMGMTLTATLITNYLFAITAFGIGRAVYTRRRRLEELRERARLAEENQAAHAAQAVAEERRRIARELHDVVAHHISVMGVLATGARRTLHRDPTAADEALKTIETTGRTTLREMKRLLNVLRTSDEFGDEELAPQPSLDGVHSLVSQLRDTGLNVNLVVDGEPYSLDPGVALTVYRIVQESLTNTLKHAGPARAGVRIQYGEESLDVEVADTGVGQRIVTSDPGRVGHGLVGMRERVALYGGTLRTGPRPGGGFRVHAVIPIDTSAALPSAAAGGTN